MSLYDHVTALPGGARALAQACLRYEVAGVMHEACRGRLAWFDWRCRNPMKRAGRMQVDELAGFLYDHGFELEVRLVPAGESRRTLNP